MIMPGGLLRTYAACAALFWLPAASHAQNDNEPPAANPGRPTVSTPATLTPVGYLQFENGALYAMDTPGLSAQLSLNQVTKLTIASRLQFISSWEPYAHSSGPGSDQPGGVSLGVQAVVLPGQGVKPTVSISYFKSLNDGNAPDIDVGSAEQSGVVLFSLDYVGFHADINGIANEQEDTGTRRAQFGQTLSVSRTLGRYTIAGELWHFSQPLTQGNTVGSLWALSYTVRPNLILDAGFNHGFTSTSTAWESFAGFTYLLPHRLWPTPAASPGPR
ncbi:MAG TPA: hypothetical protein VG893_11440 [Terracidiphilus sp.]|nr:hypothetical protein [Terracidiphilus sp.]